MNYKKGYALATLQAGRSRVRFPMGVTGIFHWFNPNGNECQECFL